ncbi:unnamed protein product [Knipowitschia caucasica]
MSARSATAGGGDRSAQAAAEEASAVEGSSMCLSDLMSPPSSSSLSSMMEVPRKRKGSTDNQESKSVSMFDEDMDDDGSDEDDQHAKVKCCREPHSQIEKRRRVRMNNLIDKLSTMIPVPHAMSRKLDKLTVLRMALQHLRSLKGSGSSFSEASYKPSFIPDEELKHLVLKAADGFLFVVGCDRGKIVFVSESVTKILNYSRSELIGQNLFDYIHPKDMSKVKEQLSASELFPRERLIDAKTGLQVQADLPIGASRLCSGARRSFFCRMKYNKVSVKMEEKEFQGGASKKKESQRFCTVHCTGYMRSWPCSQLGPEGESELGSEGEAEADSSSCLVALGRIHSHGSSLHSPELSVKPTEFVTRYAMDGKFTFVDQRATTVLGYLPQELLGTSCYEYFHQDDWVHLAERHRKVLRSKEKVETNCYKFKTKHGSFVSLQSLWFSFINPWTKEVEYIVSTNTVISYDHSRTNQSGSRSGPSSNCKTSEDGKKAVVPWSSTPGAMIFPGSIGIQIANELLDCNRINSSPPSGNVSPLSLPPKSPQTHNQTCVTSPKVPNGEATDSEKPGKSSSEEEPQGAAFSGDAQMEPSQMELDNDEETISAIMRFLATDSNLGSDFEEMHWSLI